MKSISITSLALVAALLSFASRANATTIDTFTLTHGTDVLSFVLPSTGVVGGTCFTGLSAFCTTADIDINGTINPLLEIEFIATGNGGGLIIAPSIIGTSVFTIVNAGNAQLFTGTITNPIFKLGTYALKNNTYSTNQFAENFSLTTVQSTVAATPEPSSLALLCTGLVGLGGLFRRRLFA